jgi:SAM-dependent methyltransferase
MFEAGWLSLVFNPYHVARKSLFSAISEHRHLITGRVLDVGCGTKPYQGLFDNVSQYVGLDIERPRSSERGAADVLYDGGQFPFPDNHFDSVLCSQVLEHIFDPPKFLSEIHRVLKPRGVVILTVPFIWDEHETPWDYGRYTSFGLRHLLEAHGFEICLQRKLTWGPAALLQLFSGSVHKTLQRSGASGFVIAMLAPAIFFPCNALGALMLRLMAPRDLYLDNYAVAKKVSG